MRCFRILTLFVTLAVALPAAPPAKSSHKKSTSRRRTARKRAPSYPLHPDAARYKEIQQALADKGYYKGEIDGHWGDDSVSALKTFQADQKLPDDGKISALALIGLGLGPKHESAAPAQ